MFKLFWQVLLTLLVCFDCLAQPFFEGAIQYEVTVSQSDETPSLGDQYIVMPNPYFKELGTERLYQYTYNQYKVSTNGYFKEMIYEPTTNKLYVKENPHHFFKVIDAGIEAQKLQYVEVFTDSTEVLGYTTKGIKIFFEGGSKIVYYNDQFKLNPLVYKNHDRGFLNILSSHIGAIPLKTITEVNGKIYTEVATNISEKPIAINNFKLNEPVLNNLDQGFYQVEIKGLFKVDILKDLVLEETLTNDFTVVYDNPNHGISVVLIDLSKNEIESGTFAGFKTFILSNLKNTIPNMTRHEDTPLELEEEVSGERMQFFGNVDKNDKRYYSVGLFEISSHFIAIVTETSAENHVNHQDIMNHTISSFKLP